MKLFTNIKYKNRRLGKYIVEKPLGEGRYGKCFLATSETGEKVVIKKFKLRILEKNRRKSNDENVSEAVILSNLNDERIPELLGVINEKGFYGFVLEYKQGNTVKELLFKKNYKFSKEEFFSIGIQLIKIIEYIHSNGVVHRDIRTPNVLINDGKVYLIDFGLARWGDNKKYFFDLDYSFLGDFLLYLLYSASETKDKKTPRYKNVPWYDELNISNDQKLFIKRLLGIEERYKSINDIELDFIKAFNN